MIIRMLTNFEHLPDQEGQAKYHVLNRLLIVYRTLLKNNFRILKYIKNNYILLTHKHF